MPAEVGGGRPELAEAGRGGGRRRPAGVGSRGRRMPVKIGGGWRRLAEAGGGSANAGGGCRGGWGRPAKFGGVVSQPSLCRHRSPSLLSERGTVGRAAWARGVVADLRRSKSPPEHVRPEPGVARNSMARLSVPSPAPCEGFQISVGARSLQPDLRQPRHRQILSDRLLSVEASATARPASRDPSATPRANAGQALLPARLVPSSRCSDLKARPTNKDQCEGGGAPPHSHRAVQEVCGGGRRLAKAEGGSQRFSKAGEGWRGLAEAA